MESVKNDNLHFDLQNPTFHDLQKLLGQIKKNQILDQEKVRELCEQLQWVLSIRKEKLGRPAVEDNSPHASGA